MEPGFTLPTGLVSTIMDVMLLHRQTATVRRLAWLAKALLATCLLGSMLFAHGCHGNEDNELFTTCLEWLASQ